MFFFVLLGLVNFFCSNDVHNLMMFALSAGFYRAYSEEVATPRQQFAGNLLVSHTGTNILVKAWTEDFLTSELAVAKALILAFYGMLLNQNRSYFVCMCAVIVYWTYPFILVYWYISLVLVASLVRKYKTSVVSERCETAVDPERFLPPPIVLAASTRCAALPGVVPDSPG